MPFSEIGDLEYDHDERQRPFVVVAGMFIITSLYEISLSGRSAGRS